MNARKRIERLESRLPKQTSEEFRPNFQFQVSAMATRSDAQREMVRRLRAAIADSRATNAHRAAWRLQIAKVEDALPTPAI